jgi:hypothetical protein
MKNIQNFLVETFKKQLKLNRMEQFSSHIEKALADIEEAEFSTDVNKIVDYLNENLINSHKIKKLIYMDDKYCMISLNYEFGHIKAEFYNWDEPYNIEHIDEDEILTVSDQNNLWNKWWNNFADFLKTNFPKYQFDNPDSDDCSGLCSHFIHTDLPDDDDEIIKILNRQRCFY